MNDTTMSFLRGRSGGGIIWLVFWCINCAPTFWWCTTEALMIPQHPHLQRWAHDPVPHAAGQYPCNQLRSSSSIRKPSSSRLVRLSSSSSDKTNQNSQPATDIDTTPNDSLLVEEEIKLSESGKNGNLDDSMSPPTTPPPPNLTPLLMMSLNTSPRRLFLGTLSASVIALTGNFGGVTSWILNGLPEDAVERSGLDQYFPRGDYKRYKSEFGYTFVVPKEWVQDTALELAKVQRRSGSLDYSMTRSNRRRGAGGGDEDSSNNARPKSLPDVAFGPAGYTPDRYYMQSGPNVSVAVTKVRPGQTLEGSFGSPQNAAETLLRVTIAPEGSGKVATLIGAKEEVRGAGRVYTFEYEVDRGEKGIPARAISNIAVQESGTVITMTVVAPQKEWVSGGVLEPKLRKMAESFQLITS